MLLSEPVGKGQIILKLTHWLSTPDSVTVAVIAFFKKIVYTLCIS